MSSLQSIYPCLGSPSCPLGVSQGTVPAPVKLPSTTSPGFEPGRPLTPHDTVRGTDGKGTAQRIPPTPPRECHCVPPRLGQGPSSKQPRRGSLSAAETGSGPGPSGYTAPGLDHWATPPAVCSSAPGFQQAGTGPELWNLAHGRHSLNAGLHPTPSLPIRHSPPPSLFFQMTQT